LQLYDWRDVFRGRGGEQITRDLDAAGRADEGEAGSSDEGTPATAHDGQLLINRASRRAAFYLAANCEAAQM
jgi:hypothetical protein